MSFQVASTFARISREFCCFPFSPEFNFIGQGTHSYCIASVAKPCVGALVQLTLANIRKRLQQNGTELLEGGLTVLVIFRIMVQKSVGMLS